MKTKNTYLRLPIILSDLLIRTQISKKVAGIFFYLKIIKKIFAKSKFKCNFESLNLTNQRKQINFNDNYNTPPCVWFINLCRLVGFSDFHTIGGIFCCNVFKIYKMLNPKLNVHNQQLLALNTSNSTKTISLVSELVKLNYDFAIDIQSFFKLIEDKIFWMLENPSVNSDKDLYQILALARNASKMIDPDSFEILQNYLQELNQN